MRLLLQRSLGLDRASLRASYSPYIPLFIFCVPLSRFHLPPPRCHLLSSLPRAPLLVSLLPGEGSTGGALSHVAPPGLFLPARYCSHGSLALRHQGTGSAPPAQTKAAAGTAGGKEPQQAGCQHGTAAAQTHTRAPEDSPGSRDQQRQRVGAARAWKLWQLSTPTQGNIWQSQRVTTSCFS